MSLYLRRAKIEDCDLIYNWANEEEVRKNSFNSNKIDYEGHVKWFERILESNDSYIFICCEEEKTVGQIRISIEGEEALIGFSVDKHNRGKGYGTKMLNLIEEEIKENNLNIKTLIGKVKLKNLPSQRAFEKMKYEKNIEPECLKYIKIIKQ